jgi:hypothetical protein
MRITVTESHIKRGKRFSKTACPVANAVRARLGRKLNTVSVFGGRVYLLDGKRCVDDVFDLPERVAADVVQYDLRTKPMRPFAFNLPGLN